MKTLAQIEIAIKGEIEKLVINEEYEGTSECGNIEAEILEAYKTYFNYDIQNDHNVMNYFEKCLFIEIWKYHLDVIIPRLQRTLKN
jgi:hypothetical protein